MHEYFSPLQDLFFVTEPVIVRNNHIFFSTDTLCEVRYQPVLLAGG